MFHVKQTTHAPLCNRIQAVPQSRPVDIVQTARLADVSLAAYLKAVGATTPDQLIIAIERMQVSCAVAALMLQRARVCTPAPALH